ncbi:major intrinsically disordered NOTCH2-binding receptor 1-like homolog [Hypomesus transpacificus]|uniref:major intrinsically disordered NOTCH2-binding receptor 1-like homolog n=1 Tax=Hypomesus transpacificus TaxID=137520 RepID=UPI001F079E5D|nr:major intrinsically disordered NOTCH2-binding receptor 1-like homolog [Hypomesus transpacificus]
MDISVLPNNNHPEKFLQLDVGMLPFTHGMFQVEAAMTGQRHWHNRVYSQVGGYLEKHITPVTFKTNIKRNPLYMDIRTVDSGETQKSKPSWTIQEYDRHSIHANLADYMKKTPKDLDFWLEDLYTPGYDSLLKKKEAEQKRKKMCKVVSWIILSICVIIVIITVPIVISKRNNN